jgi:Flp pilus assembly protein TadG
MEAAVRHDGRSRIARDESGQVLILAALAMAMLLVMVALVVDIGKAYLVQRQLQASVDAAALAGAQHLPVTTEVTQVAQEYGPSQGSKNEVTVGGNVTTSVTLRCVASAPGCSPATNEYNAVNVKATSDVSLLFARILGIDELKVRAQATACSPCTAKPLDIMLVIDRTGSMCQINGQNDPNCTDLNFAKEGARTFLRLMDPTIDKVGLALFPPVLNRSEVGTCPYTPWQGTGNPAGSRPNGRYFGYDAWWPEWDLTGSQGQDPSVYAVAALEFDYLVKSGNSWILSPQSAVVQRLGCAGGAGSTHYASGIEEAQHELGESGRGDVQDVIIFLSDGAANTSPKNIPMSHWRNSFFNQPCGAGIQAATNAKQAGILVYSIGYDLKGDGTDYEKCRRPNPTTGHQDNSQPVEGINAQQAMEAIATDPDGAGPIKPFFYNKPQEGELKTIFRQIAADLQRPAARLIDDNTP